jgi:hypothetical protein
MCLCVRKARLPRRNYRCSFLVPQPVLSSSSLATHATLADVPASLRASESRLPTITLQTEVLQSQVDHGAGTTTRPPLVAATPHPCNREPALPISEGRYKIQFTASQRVRDLLQEAQGLFRNQRPSGDVEVIVERALVLLVTERKRQLFAQTNKPRRSTAITSSSTSKPNPRHIPHLGTPQYHPTRSGISDAREPHTGLNQPRARKPE